MLRTHDKLPDEVDRQDPDFIQEYQAFVEAERRVRHEEEEAQAERSNDPKAKARAIMARHKQLNTRLVEQTRH
jgi:hypothetical protein